MIIFSLCTERPKSVPAMNFLKVLSGELHTLAPSLSAPKFSHFLKSFVSVDILVIYLIENYYFRRRRSV